MGGASLPYTPHGWGCAPDPAFLQWNKVPNGLKSQYTKLKTNQAIILVNITPKGPKRREKKSQLDQSKEYTSTQ